MKSTRHALKVSGSIRFISLYRTLTLPPTMHKVMFRRNRPVNVSLTWKRVNFYDAMFA